MFLTRYRFKCAGCGETHGAMTEAFYKDGQLISAKCGEEDQSTVPSSTSPNAMTTRAMPRGKSSRDKCPECFQIPSNNGTCGCVE